MSPPFTGAQVSVFRQQAEEMASGLAARNAEDLQNLSPEEIRQMIHDLRVRQLELELENEALPQCQAGLMNREVTEQCLADDAQKHQAALINSMVDSLPDAIYYKDLDGVYQLVNAASARIFGLPPDKIIGKTDHDLFDRELADSLLENDRAAVATGKPLQSEEWIVQTDGSTLPYESVKSPFVGLDGTALGVIGVSRNISERKRIKQMLLEREESYRSQFEQNSAMMLLIDRSDWSILDANHAAERFYGYPAGQLKTMRIYDINTQAHGVIGESLTTLKVNEGHRFETWHRLADGSLRDVEVCSSHIQFAGRSVNHSIIFDITPRKLAEAELDRVSKIQGALMHLATAFVNVPIEQQNEAIEQSLATMGQMIAADRAYHFAYDLATGAASNTHEWCAAGVTSRIRNSQNVPREGFEEFLAAHSQGQVLTIPSVAAMPPGSQQRAVLEARSARSLTTLPLMQDATCIGFIGFDAVQQERVWQEEEIALMRVLAELYMHFDARVKADRASRQLQQQLMVARDEAQAAAQSKSVFLANMSHEIRTPLNAILGYAQIIQLEDKESANNGRLRAITRSGDHLLTLIDNLLELVRSDNRTIELAPADFDLEEMLEDVLLIFADKPETRGLALNIIPSPNGPQVIHADQGKIRQILVNLVSNALKFTQTGSVNITPSVISDTPKDDLILAIDVTDTGCGIRANELESIFELFVQSASGRNSGKGSGIGLHLSRRYARALGGDVTVTSQPEHGSCFRLTFRCRACGDEMLAQRQRGEVRRLATGQAACHILVVDDDATNRDMLKMMLEGVGFSVELAERATTALGRMQQSDRVDLVLMDKHMPEMDGYEAIRRIRSLPTGQSVAILVVTASGIADEAGFAKAAGADGYVSKPIRRSDLLDEVRRVTGVRYEYESSRTPAAPAPAALSPTELSAVPVVMRERLAEALLRGNIRSMRLILDEIAVTYPGVAAGMVAILRNYHYERLQDLLDASYEPQKSAFDP